METTSLPKSRPVEVRTKIVHKNPILNWLDSFFRRLTDITVSFFGILILLPALILIATAIKRDSPGPVFYKGRRMGKGGKEFNILKFRTMYDGGNVHNGAKITAQDDPRITPTGKWLRETKINELPQLWNVLIGDMSLVGPRPEDPDIVRTWSEDYQRLLLSIKPGITSPATILYRDEESLLSSDDFMQDYLKEIMPTKMRMDELYIRNRSIFTDLDVIFWTAIALLPKIGRPTIPQYLLYWGPFSRIFSRHLSWFVIDSLIALLAIAISGLIWRLSRPLDVGFGISVLYALGISLIFGLMNWFLGLNKVEWSRAPASDGLTLAVSTSVATITILVLDNQLPIPPFPTSMIIIAAVLSFLGFATARYRERLITGFGIRWLKFRGGVRNIGERVLIVGAGENSGLAAWIFRRSSLGRAASVIGIVDDDPRKQGLSIDGYDVIGTTSTIPELVRKYDIGLIFFTIDNITVAQRAKILTSCYRTGVKVVVLPDILEILRKELKVVHKPENGVYANPTNGDAGYLLDEIQSLIIENKVEQAQERLLEFRQKYHPNQN